ncbi:hypothetical protein D3C74_324270 [compost metagenome]
MSTNTKAIARMAIQAPCVNLVSSTMTRTVPVMPNPIVLTTRERFILVRKRGSGVVRSSRVQCLIIPSWDSVKDTNTPTM